MKLVDSELGESGLNKLLNYLRDTKRVDLKDDSLIYLGRLALLEKEPEVIGTSFRGNIQNLTHRCVVYTNSGFKLEQAEGLLNKVGFFENDPLDCKDVINELGHYRFILGTPKTSYKFIEFLSKEMCDLYEETLNRRAIPVDLFLSSVA